MHATEVADRVHRLAHAHVNCYLIEDDEGVTLVDAGLPSMWGLLTDTLRRLGLGPGDVRALVLTHGHFDHVGFARRARVELGVPVLVHPADDHLAAHPYSYKPQRNRLLYALMHPRSLPVLGRMAMAGALNVRGIEDTEELAVGSALEVPGRPTAMFAPGHTGCHCILHLPERDTVISGDALVTLDPYTGATGPQIVASAATADTARAMESLRPVEATGAATVLPGHGEPWTDGVASAVSHARDVGEH
ncbi:MULTISPECIES: MBL fold metallo-hydrolase [Dietzia]|uniref:MBL fold metallo-hydrolase n=1 Tax=Dietzia cinnamea TaxID=321318 RepID=A0AAW5Q6T9_9ACTN|nr:MULTISPECIES: MBL fold metallo-hydrolase [Dietzia]PWD95879.1 MBL fold metallo-hydrolase [Dietzia maris]MBM7230853.1 MBL fold metallo-hydrolase [Dietzia cinnamea]MCT1863972.1 MBL fold metallo-hydrolase [Dietzia cinnamea]MCT2030148.1 MBL fold metallo-hydrolase [Dietzia cinnamea]MCT2033783.1 MBL fold metallo-hydrolase [Dietzia cinnamea]